MAYLVTLGDTVQYNCFQWGGLMSRHNSRVFNRTAYLDLFKIVNFRMLQLTKYKSAPNLKCYSGKRLVTQIFTYSIAYL